jgi:hypothetical protein
LDVRDVTISADLISEWLCCIQKGIIKGGGYRPRTIRIPQVYQAAILHPLLYPTLGITVQCDPYLVDSYHVKYLRYLTASPTCATCHSYVQKSTGQHLLLCSRCKKVYYCCKEHQAYDWKYGGHKASCGKEEVTVITITVNL